MLYIDFDGVITVEKYGTPTMVAYISEKTGLSYDKVDLEYRKYNKDLLQGRIQLGREVTLTVQDDRIALNEAETVGAALPEAAEETAEAAEIQEKE